MSPDKVTKPVDLYLRVSDVRGRAGESYISVPDQERKARGFCALKGYEVGQVFTDEDETGGKMDRPEFEKAMQRALSGESGGIICAKLDRFARNAKGLLEHVDQLDNAGAVWGCAEPTIDTADPVFGRFLLTLFGAMAELELGRIGVAWGAAKSNAVLSRGIHLSRHCPPGYVREERENGISERTGKPRTKILGPLEPHPEFGAVMTEAYEMASRGVGYAEIARYLTERQLPSGDDHGKRTVWQSNRIKRLLANRVYLGEARYGDIVNPEAHEALTDATTFLLAQRASEVPPTPTSTYLLSGIARCAHCRHSMRPQRPRGTNVGSYRCGHSEVCEQPSSVSMNRLDDFVYEHYVERMFAKESEPVVRQDDSELQEELREAQAHLDKVLGDEEKLSEYGVFEHAREAALERVAAVRAALASPRLLDLQQVAADALPRMLDEADRVKAGGRVLDGMSSDGVALLKQSMSREIQAVFVRPAKSRSKTAPLEDRVRIVWSDEELIDLPTRGRARTLEPYVWE
jgi:site-specific DNA recombinase